METTIERILYVVAAIPAVYGFVCWTRRDFNARKAARWVKETHQEEWNKLHWLSKRHPWASVEALITKGIISGPEVNEYRARDEYLEKATWVGLFITAVLLLVIHVFFFFLRLDV